MEVNHVDVSGAAQVQQVQPHPLLLVHSQARQVVDHPVDGCKDRERQSLTNLCTRRGWQGPRRVHPSPASLHARRMQGPLCGMMSARTTDSFSQPAAERGQAPFSTLPPSCSQTSHHSRPVLCPCILPIHSPNSPGLPISKPAEGTPVVTGKSARKAIHSKPP